MTRHGTTSSRAGRVTGALAEVVRDLVTLEGGATIYAARIGGSWSEDSPAIAVTHDDEPDPPMVVDGMPYFLEVFVAREVLEDWAAAIGQDAVPLDEQVGVLMHYAANDAPPPTP